MLRYSIGASDPVWGELMKQITRLEQLDKFPFGPEAKKDLGAALAQADSLDEARAVIDEFVQAARAGEKCPLAGDISAMIDQRRARLPVPMVPFTEPTAPNSTHCGRCQGFGYFGGYIAGPRHAPWQWCDCKNAKRVQYESPNLVDEANSIREKLVKRFTGKLASMVKTDGLQRGDDGYRGEF
jgi:hypothetical protein